MILRLVTSISEPNRVTKQYTLKYELEGTLREGTSILRPNILVQADANIVECNYAIIPEFNRVYFIDDIVSVRDGLWNLICRVDVLSTYASYFKTLPCVVARQENEYNLFLNDDRFLVNSNRLEYAQFFPNSLSTTGGASYVITVAGGADAATGSTTNE